MTEEIHGSVQGGNGERLEVKLGTKSLGLQTKDLIPILLLLAGCVGGFLIYTNIMEAVRLIYTRQEKVLEALHAHRALIVEEVHAAQQGRAEDLAAIQGMLRTHEYNQYQEPDKRLPLDLVPQLLPHAEPKR
jgi:hypothetical protein